MVVTGAGSGEDRTYGHEFRNFSRDMSRSFSRMGWSSTCVRGGENLGKQSESADGQIRVKGRAGAKC